MVMRKHYKHLYKFGPFQLDARERLLICDGKMVALAPKVFDTLLCLVRNNGRILEKEDLLNSLWPDTIVEESNLTTYISQLRKALGENGGYQNFIETIPRRGYRFIPDVEEITDDDEEVLIEQRSGTKIIIEEIVEAEIPNEMINSPTEIQSGSSPQIIPALDTKTKILRFLKNRPLLVVGLSLLLAVALMLPFLFLRQSIFKNGGPPFQRIASSRLTTNGKVPLAAISPDGKYIAYVVRESTSQSLWLRQTEATTNIQIAPPTNVNYLSPTFSPDGLQIYYVTYEKIIKNEMLTLGVLHQIPTLGGTPKKILEDVDSQVAISPDGKQIAFIRNNPENKEASLVIAQADGTNERVLMTRKAPYSFSIPAGPAWSPDSKLLACAVGNDVPGDFHMNVNIIRVDNGESFPVGPQKWHWVGQIAWLHDGSGLIANAWHLTSKAISDQIWYLSYPRGNIEQVTKDVNNYQGLSIAWNTSSLLTVQDNRLTRFWMIPTSDYSKAVPITTGIGDGYSQFLGMEWTPDGKILYGTQASGNTDIWVMDADGKNQKQLTTDPFSDLAPIISADGKTIYYSSYRDGIPHIWKMNADGTDPKQLTKGKFESEISVTPDGNWLVFIEEDQKKRFLKKIPTEGGEPITISDQNILRAALSPDGKTIAIYTWDTAEKKYKFGFMDFEKGQVVRQIPALKIPRFGQIKWLPDGSAITFIVNTGDVSNIWKQPVNSGDPQQITNFSSDQIFRFAWSRDGKFLTIERGMDVNDIIHIKSLNN